MTQHFNEKDKFAGLAKVMEEQRLKGGIVFTKQQQEHTGRSGASATPRGKKENTEEDAVEEEQNHEHHPFVIPKAKEYMEETSDSNSTDYGKDEAERAFGDNKEEFSDFETDSEFMRELDMDVEVINEDDSETTDNTSL